MSQNRIKTHPVLSIPKTAPVSFSWNGQPLEGTEGETIASALMANGVRVFGHHPKDFSPQGLYCANGQCAQCMVLVNGTPVKACTRRLQPGSLIMPADGLLQLPRAADNSRPPETKAPQAIEVPVLIVGGGPAGMSAALSLAEHGIESLLVDDKDRLGGKLVLQPHRFFGSANAVFAGVRGMDIAARLSQSVLAETKIKARTQCTAVSVFSDGHIGLVQRDEAGHESYVLVKPTVLLAATGAREKSIVFKGNTLPGVIGAGAFQTLVNRDLVKPASHLFVVGGGNVGLIAAYHALQAGISVVGLCEALPECGGYKVHKDKLLRAGVPIWTSHTIVSANGHESVDSVTIARVDESFHPIAGTERSYLCDMVLIAVGLESAKELYSKAQEFGMPVFAAGDADEVAEASAAIFSGKIQGQKIARSLGAAVGEIPPLWYRSMEILRSKPGAVVEERIPAGESGAFPVFHCSQEIPCDPCGWSCSQNAIFVDPDDIRHLPTFIAEEVGTTCIGCEKCVAICPGQAITLVDYRKDAEHPFVVIPYELGSHRVHIGDTVTVLDVDGHVLGNVVVTAVHAGKVNDRTAAVKVKAPKSIAKRIAGIRTHWDQNTPADALDHYIPHWEDDAIVCRCERVRADTIRGLIREGYRDISEIKAVTRAEMGACGGKTCASLIHRLFREEGIADKDVADPPKRSPFSEVPLSVFAGMGGQEAEGQHA